MFSVSVAGENLITKLVQNVLPINFKTFRFTDLKVTYLGQDFFDTDLVNEKGAGLVLSLNNEDWVAYKEKITVRGEESSYTAAFTTNPVNSGTTDLKSIKSISTGDISIARLGNEESTQEVRIGFHSVNADGVVDHFMMNSIYVPLISFSLSNLHEKYH